MANNIRFDEQLRKEIRTLMSSQHQKNREIGTWGAKQYLNHCHELPDGYLDFCKKAEKEN